jgi:hypothetical protein
MILGQDPGKVAINPDKFDKLITALGTAVDSEVIVNRNIPLKMAYLMHLG